MSPRQQQQPQRGCCQQRQASPRKKPLDSDLRPLVLQERGHTEDVAVQQDEQDTGNPEPNQVRDASTRSRKGLHVWPVQAIILLMGEVKRPADLVAAV